MKHPCLVIMIVLTMAAAADDGPRQATSIPGERAQSSPQSQPHAQMDDRLRRRLEEIDQRSATINDVRAEFIQTKRTTMLKRPLISVGTLVAKGDRVRWDTTGLRPSIMTIGAGEIRIFYPEAHVVEVYATTGDVRELTGSPLPRLSILHRQFDIAELDPATLGAGDQALAIGLTPRSEDLRKHLKSVNVLMDTEVPAATKLVMTDADGDCTEIEFKNIRVNTGVKDDEMDMQVPPGVRTIRPAGDRPSSRPAATMPSRERGP